MFKRCVDCGKHEWTWSCEWCEKDDVCQECLRTYIDRTSWEDVQTDWRICTECQPKIKKHIES